MTFALNIVSIKALTTLVSFLYELGSLRSQKLKYSFATALTFSDELMLVYVFKTYLNNILFPRNKPEV